MKQPHPEDNPAEPRRFELPCVLFHVFRIFIERANVSALRRLRLVCHELWGMVEEELRHRVHDRTEAVAMLACPRIAIADVATMTNRGIPMMLRNPGAWAWIQNLLLHKPPVEAGFADKMCMLRGLRDITICDSSCALNIPDEICQLTNLRHLSLHSCKIRELPSTLWTLTNLVALSLDGNWLSSISEDIGRLTQLRNLSVNRNMLAQLPSAIGELTGLISLECGFNEISQLSCEIGRLTNLRNLDVRHNPLIELPDVIHHLTDMRSLNVEECGLVAPPAGIEALTQLEKYTLSDNYFGARDNEFQGIARARAAVRARHGPVVFTPAHWGGPSLSSLSINACGLRVDMLEHLGVLVGLQKLVMANNYLDCVPDGVFNMENLADLDLHGNRISRFPDELTRLTNLRSLRLSENRIGELPQSIGGLIKLENLFVDDNNIEVLPNEIGRLENLNYLDISGNQLAVLPAAIGGCTNLLNLRLSNNITALPPEVAQLVRLKSLIIRENYYRGVPRERYVWMLAQLRNCSVVT